MRSLSLRRSALALAVAAATTLSVPSVQALPSPPDGIYFRIHDQSDHSQGRAVAAMAPDGRHVVVWTEAGPAGQRVLARLYPAAGTEGGPVIVVADETETMGVVQARVVMAPNGYWVVAWNAIAVDAPGMGIFGRMFDGNGAPLGRRFALDATPSEEPWAPTIAITPNGYHHVAAWVRYEAEGPSNVLVRPFVLDSALAEPVAANAPGTPVLGQPAVAVGNDDDAFVVVWIGGLDPQDTTPQVIARRFDRMASPLGEPYLLSEPGRSATSPQIASDAQGRFVAAWVDLDDHTLRYRRLDAMGTPVAPEVIVPTQPNSDVADPKLAVTATGGFSLLYTENSPEFGERRAVVASYDAQDQFVQGHALFDAMEGDEFGTGLATDADGDVIALWRSNGSWSVEPRQLAIRLLHLDEIELGISVQAPSLIDHGDYAWYSIEVANNVPWNAVDGVGNTAGFTLRLDLPQESTFGYAEAIDWSCNGTGPVDCTYLGDLRPGESSYPLQVSTIAPQHSTDLVAQFSLLPRHVDRDASNDNVEVRTEVRDMSVNPFVFVDRTGVPRSTWQESNDVVVSGVEVPVLISIWDGQYRVNGGSWTASGGIVQPGDTIRLRHMSASAFGSSVNTRLIVDGTSDWFTTTTETRDVTPDSFAFVDQVDVGLGLPVNSAPITVSGINDAVPVSVTGGSYSLNGGAFTSVPGTARAGDMIRVQHMAPLSHGTRTDTALSVGGVSDTFSSTTVPRDVTPDAFAFAAQSSVLRGSEQTSAEVIISGMNDAAPITVSGGSYSLNGGAFTNAAATITNGQRLRLRHIAASGFATTTTTTVTVGTANATFDSTTEAQDAVPNAFAFVDRSGLATAVEVISDPITVAGINVPAPLSVTGGSYSLNGGAFTTAAGSVVAGDQVRVKHVSAASANTAVTTTLTIGGVSDGFTSTTGASDSTPNAYAFADVIGAKRNKAVISAPVTVSGINVAVPVSVAGGGARWSKNGGAYTTAAGSAVNGDVVRLQVTTPNAASFSVNVQVSIGGIADTWTVNGN